MPSACSAATCSRVFGSRERSEPADHAVGGGVGAQRRPQPVHPSAAELEQRVDAEPSPGPAGDARDAAAAHEVIEVRDGGDELHAFDDVLRLGLDLVERRAPLGGLRRRQHDERFGAGRRRGVDDSHPVVELTGGDRRRLVRTAHAGRDREDEDAVVGRDATRWPPGTHPAWDRTSRRARHPAARSAAARLRVLSRRRSSATSGTTVIACRATSSDGRAAALSVTMATVTAPRPPFARTAADARDDQQIPSTESTTRDGSSRPMSGQVTAPSRAAASAGADGRQRERHPDHHVEGGEREDALLPVELRLQRAHPGGEREGGGGAEADRAEVRRPTDPATRLNTATTTPITSVAERGALDRVAAAAARCSAAMPSTAPAPNNAMSQPNSASLASRTSRTNTMPIENSAPSPSATAAAAGITARTSGMRNAPRKPAFSVGARRRPPRRRGRSRGRCTRTTRGTSTASIQNTSACVRPPDVAPREGGDRGERGRAQRDAPVRRAEDQPVRERQLVAVDDVGDRRVPRAGGTRCWPPRRGTPTGRSTTGRARTGRARSSPRAGRVHREHRAAAVPAARRTRRQRAADRGGDAAAARGSRRRRPATR